MTPEKNQSQRWKARRWLLTIAIVFAGQVGLIFLLGEHSPAHARTRGPMVGFRLSSPSASELLAISDPTLFALPHPEGFSGRAWLHGFSQKLPSFEWSEPPQWLPLPVAQLGQAFKRFMETNQANSTQPLAVAEAELMIPQISSEPVLRSESIYTIAGPASKRRLLTPMRLKSWPHPDLLTNTVVHFFVDDQGRTFSPTKLSGSGLKEADEYAVGQVRAARFESIAPSGPQSTSTPSRMTAGEFIFQWNTLPMPPTNTPPTSVAP